MKKRKLPISCFIIARNEGDRITATIESVKDLVEEIIVIDSGSKDNTVAICESLGARVLYNHWTGYGPQKRFGEDHCSKDWLLNLDADEVLTADLVYEILEQFPDGKPPSENISGFYFRICDMLPGEAKLLPYAHTNTCLRLYNKNKARFSDSPVHDSVILREGDTEILQNPVLHYSFRGLSHMLSKINDYSDAQSELLYRNSQNKAPANAVNNQPGKVQGKGIRKPYFRLLIEFPFAFIKIYFLRLYILRGWRGFIYSMAYAFGRFLRVAKYVEKMR